MQNVIPSHTPEGEIIFSVSELNLATRTLLEQHYGKIYVCGEVSNMSTPASGHLYFTLKDPRAQIRCALFRGKMSTRVALQDGMQIIVQANVSLYPDRGDFQLIVEQVMEAGSGLLMQQFEALKKQLAAKGLFAESHKRPLPRFPKTLAVITSDTGAALQDILTVLKRRFPAIQILVYASQVQGEQAAAQLITALKRANFDQQAEIIILARGGGSLEDLWSFNNEALAYAIFNSIIPVVSAVGHEVDFTIADFVADCRAPTPSAAAELVSPDQQKVLSQVQQYQQRLTLAWAQQYQNMKQQLLYLTKRLRHPRQVLQDQAQRLDLLALRLQKAVTQRQQSHQQQMDFLIHRLKQQQLSGQLRLLQQHLITLLARLIQSSKHRWQTQQQRLSLLVQALDTLSPLATLSRGYAIAQLSENNTLLTHAHQVKPGDQVKLKLARGQLACTVNKIIN